MEKIIKWPKQVIPIIMIKIIYTREIMWAKMILMALYFRKTPEKDVIFGTFNVKTKHLLKTTYSKEIWSPILFELVNRLSHLTTSCLNVLCIHTWEILFLINISEQNSDNLLMWSSNISDNENCNTFVIIQYFIIKSKRFV